MSYRHGSLLRRFDRLTMADGEDVTVFSRHLTTLVGEIRSLAEKVQEKTVVQRLFSAMPRRFSPIISTIEQWEDISRCLMLRPSVACARLKKASQIILTTGAAKTTSCCS